MKILIGVDATSSCQEAVQAAAARPWPAESSFLLVTAIDPLFFAKAPVSLDQAKKCAHQHLKRMADCLHRAGWNTDEAEKWGADMIVVGSHGRSGFDRFTMGSVSETVALHAGCSVEVIRE